MCITHTGAGPDHFPTTTAASAATRCFFLLSFLRSSSTVPSVTGHSPMARPHAYHQSPLTRAKGALAMHPLYSAEFPVACDERSMAGGTNQQSIYMYMIPCDSFFLVLIEIQDCFMLQILMLCALCWFLTFVRVSIGRLSQKNWHGMRTAKSNMCQTSSKSTDVLCDSNGHKQK